jgi:hypothetical protein
MRTVGTTIASHPPPAAVPAMESYHEWDPVILRGEGAGATVRQCGYFTEVADLFPGETPRRAEEGFHALNRAPTQRAESSAGVRRVE